MTHDQAMRLYFSLKRDFGHTHESAMEFMKARGLDTLMLKN